MTAFFKLLNQAGVEILRRNALAECAPGLAKALREVLADHFDTDKRDIAREDAWDALRAYDRAKRVPNE